MTPGQVGAALGVTTMGALALVALPFVIKGLRWVIISSIAAARGRYF